MTHAFTFAFEILELLVITRYTYNGVLYNFSHCVESVVFPLNVFLVVYSILVRSTLLSNVYAYDKPKSIEIVFKCFTRVFIIYIIIICS